MFMQPINAVSSPALRRVFVGLCGLWLTSASLAKAEVVSADDMSYTARQLLQIALQDDDRLEFFGLDGVIGPETLEAIGQWQALEGLSELDPMDTGVVCPLIKKGIKGHGSSSKLPSFCN